MIKTRRADYCNLKLLLIFLVVYGHWIEPQIGTSYATYLQYRMIYLIHMPLFAFSSGLFLRNEEDCIRQIKCLLPMYLMLQGVAVIIAGASPVKPWWHLWYLLSCCAWMTAAWLWFRYGKEKGKLIILVLAVLTGLLAGCVPFLGRTFSALRTLVFFPFFWLGVISEHKTQWSRLRSFGLMSFAAAVIVILIFGKNISISLLYGAEPYENAESGVLLRMLCYLVSTLTGFFC